MICSSLLLISVGVGILPAASSFGGLHRERFRSSRREHHEDECDEPWCASSPPLGDPFVAYVKEPEGRVGALLSRSDAESVIGDLLFPDCEHAERLDLGRDAQNIVPGAPVRANDPRMAYTYGEFPLSSCDELVDIAIRAQENREGSSNRRRTLVDLGSGAGRLVLYLALTRGATENSRYDVHGIEISDLLHGLAMKSLERGAEAGYFVTKAEAGSSLRTVQLHLGPAESMAKVLEDADVIFAYSTVWPTSESEDTADGFNVELGALVLGKEWSRMLAEYCRPGCAVVTTDRALDPAYGWHIVDRRDVDNPEVFGSTGYVHILRK